MFWGNSLPTTVPSARGDNSICLVLGRALRVASCIPSILSKGASGCPEAGEAVCRSFTSAFIPLRPSSGDEPPQPRRRPQGAIVLMVTLKAGLGVTTFHLFPVVLSHSKPGHNEPRFVKALKILIRKGHLSARGCFLQKLFNNINEK